MEKTTFLIFFFFLTAVSAASPSGSNDLRSDSKGNGLNWKPPRKSNSIAELSAPFEAKPPRISPGIANRLTSFENGGIKAKPLVAFTKGDISSELDNVKKLSKVATFDRTHSGPSIWKRKTESDALNKKERNIEKRTKSDHVKKAKRELTLQEKFIKAAVDVKKFTKSLKDDEKDEIYALYKQATVGNMKTCEPSNDDFGHTTTRMCNAWKHKWGTDSDKAKLDFVDNVNGLIDRFGKN